MLGRVGLTEMAASLGFRICANRALGVIVALGCGSFVDWKISLFQIGLRIFCEMHN